MTPSSEIAGASSEARHELPEGEKLKPFAPHSKPTKDEFGGSNSSIPSFPSPSPSSPESVRSSLVHSQSIPDPLNKHQTSPSSVGLRFPPSKSFPPYVQVRSPSSPALPYYHQTTKPSSASLSPLGLKIPIMANVKEALTRSWEALLSFPKRTFRKKRERDEEVKLENIHPILWAIDEYEIAKNFLIAFGVSATVALMVSNSPGTGKTGTHVGAATLPVSFATLFIGLLNRKNSTRISLLFQLVGIGLAIFALLASAFSFLTLGFKCIPVFTGVVCLGILVIPVPYLITYKRGSYMGCNAEETEDDAANDEENPAGSQVSLV
ncbi:hypothetical protein L6164_001849 [Bauhinia variegata]|uniref:Uncharacterized protein n=1 Tax=Bauhinia variegata TaxID=167791 RepID=A0ACB9QDA2_BAUVA|nr:hypothetical protein L6164_001849 [Bauhinia variegata]